MLVNPIYGSGGDSAFSSFTTDGKFKYPVENIVIPATVTRILGSTDALRGHTEIKHITFEPRSALITIGSDAFNGCSGLESIDLPSTGLSQVWGNSVFVNCTSLVSLTIPDGVVSIGNWTCSGCTSLKSISLPSSIASMNNANSFNNCSAVTDIMLGENWNYAANFSFTNILTHDSMVAMLENLADLTGQTAKTLTLGETNLARLSEEEKAIATAKNWVLA